MPGTDTTFESNVMAPVTVTAPANNLPQDVAPVSIVMVVSASTLPLNTEYLLMVAELPTCQKTLEALAPLISLISLPGAPGAPTAVVRVDDGIWKMKRAFGSP